ncbi:MAG: hypothetical protein QXR98_03710 [Fervidicoccaceae archaeon]
MGLKNILGMIMTFLGAALLLHGLYIGLTHNPRGIFGEDSLTFIVGTYLLIAGPGYWLGEVPKEVLSRVRKEALGAKEGEQK